MSFFNESQIKQDRFLAALELTLKDGIRHYVEEEIQIALGRIEKHLREKIPGIVLNLTKNIELMSYTDRLVIEIRTDNLKIKKE